MDKYLTTHLHLKSRYALIKFRSSPHYFLRNIMTTVSGLSQDRMDVFEAEDALIPCGGKKLHHAKIGKVEHVFVLPKQLEDIEVSTLESHKAETQFCETLLSILSPLERRIVEKYFFQNMSPGDISKEEEKMDDFMVRRTIVRSVAKMRKLKKYKM